MSQAPLAMVGPDGVPGASSRAVGRGASTIAARLMIVLATTVAVCGSGCGGATPQTRSSTSPQAIIGLSRGTGSAALPPTATTGTVRAQGARRKSGSGLALAATRVPHGVSVWLPYWNMQAALDSALANAGLVGTASPFWYAISGDSAIEGNPGAGEQSIIDELRGRGIRVVPTVTETEDMHDFDRMLGSAPRRVAMVHALVTIARSRVYSGLDLDFEDFAVDRGHSAAPADEAAARYPAFVAEVCRALHAIGRSCTVTIMPRTTGEHVYWRGHLATWVYDYGALAKVADRVRIMAYDEHAPDGPPGPIAPYPWVKQVMAYASSTMAVGKVELALPAYGYDWSGGKATVITSRQAPQLAVTHGVSPSWDPVQAEDTFRYTAAGRRHIVWYEGAIAAHDRGRLAKAAGLAGIDLWAAGGEDPAVWPLLRALYAR
jgi:spore germination protein